MYANSLTNYEQRGGTTGDEAIDSYFGDVSHVDTMPYQNYPVSSAYYMPTPVETHARRYSELSQPHQNYGMEIQPIPPQMTVHLSTKTWVNAYLVGVAPFVSSKLDIFDTTEIDTVMNAKSSLWREFPVEYLIRAFVQGGVVAHGSRYCGYIDLAAKYAQRAYRVLETVLDKKAHNISHMASTSCSTHYLHHRPSC